MTRIPPPLLRAGDFQTAWYLSMLVFAMLLVFTWSTVRILQSVPSMWRTGERGMALLLTAVAAVVVTFFVCLFLVVAIGLLRRSGVLP